MKIAIPLFAIALVVIGVGVSWKLIENKRQPLIPNTVNIDNGQRKDELIRLEYPQPNQLISSPLTIKGEARGNWFFEASFPVVLTDWDGLIIANGIATAKGDWMTNDFVPFEATLEFALNKEAYSNRGSLILKKENPSGLPENDDALEIPVSLSPNSD